MIRESGQPGLCQSWLSQNPQSITSLLGFKGIISLPERSIVTSDYSPPLGEMVPTCRDQRGFFQSLWKGPDHSVAECPAASICWFWRDCVWDLPGRESYRPSSRSA